MLNEFDKHIAEEIHAMDPPFYALIAAAVMKADSTNLRLLSRAYPDICTAVLGDTWLSIVYDVLRPVIVGCACDPPNGMMCVHHYEQAEEDAAEVRVLSAEDLLAKLALSSAYGKNDIERESAECPGCHQTFYAPSGHDPLKRHIDYCVHDHSRCVAGAACKAGKGAESETE